MIAAIAHVPSAEVERAIDFLRAKRPQKRNQHNVADVIEAFLTWCEKSDHPLRSMREGVVVLYLQSLVREGVTKRVAWFHLDIIRTFFNALVAAGMVERNPATAVTVPAPATTPAIILAAREARKLLSVVPTDTARDLLDRALIAVISATFVPLADILRMKVEDCLLEAGTRWTRMRRASGEGYLVPLPLFSEQYVRPYVEQLSGGPRDPAWRSQRRRPRTVDDHMLARDVKYMLAARSKKAGTAIHFDYGTLAGALAIAELLGEA